MNLTLGSPYKEAAVREAGRDGNKRGYSTNATNSAEFRLEHTPLRLRLRLRVKVKLVLCLC